MEASTALIEKTLYLSSALFIPQPTSTRLQPGSQDSTFCKNFRLFPMQAQPSYSAAEQ